MKLFLHDYRRCPFCIRTRIVLHLKNIEYKHIHEPLREWTDWMLEHVEKPRVPVLHIAKKDEEIIMPESNEINLWLDSNFGKKKFTPKLNSPEYKKMLDWWEWCESTFKPQIDRYKYGENRIFDTEKHLLHTKDLSLSIQTIEDTLKDSSHLISESMTLADIAIIPFIRQIMRTRNGEFNFSSFPYVLKWSGTILNQEWFNLYVMKKY